LIKCFSSFAFNSNLRRYNMAMNDDGCWCDDQFGSGGTFQRVPTEECAASSLALKQCGAGPCGARSVRNAIYEVGPS